MLTDVAGKLGRAAVELVFPARCGACGASGSFICDACRVSLVSAAPPRCARCWRPGRFDIVCASCKAAPPAYHRLRAAFVFDGAARDLVHALKFRGMSALAGPMGDLLADDLAGYAIDCEVIVPVPLAGNRKRTRGYNQAQALSRAVARRLQMPVDSRALKRMRNTPAQARSTDATQRRRNVAGAFHASADAVRARSVLLIDDVTTTGATLDACSRALTEAGAARVWAVAFARED